MRLTSEQYFNCNNARFIYKYNKKDISEFQIDGKWNYPSILKLYMKEYYSKVIDCSDLGITSFPIYPNMVAFNCTNNQLNSFPIQPKMEKFYGDNNQLTSFPIQPNMTIFFW